tara:strand:- start:661 stop:915 length:255 start_codon:yes stop_codon:yes gene_type:complete
MKTNISQFTWHRDNEAGEGELSVDASELGLEPGKVPETVEVNSPHTGKTRTFELCGRLVHGEDVIGWSYWDDEDPIVQVVIYND